MVVALSRFISKLTDKCLPFFKALKNKWDFHWTSECHTVFKDLKTYLQQPPVLVKPTVCETLFLYLVVSDVAVSSMLIKEEEST